MHFCFSTLRKKATWELWASIPFYSSHIFTLKMHWAFTLCKIPPYVLRYENDPDTWLWVLWLMAEPHCMWLSWTVWVQKCLRGPAGGAAGGDGVGDGAKWPPVWSESTDSCIMNHACWGHPEERKQPKLPFPSRRKLPESMCFHGDPRICQDSISSLVPRLKFKWA